MNKDLIAGLAWGGGIVAVALGMTAARKAGYVDGDTVTRVVICLNGFMIAWYGNRMPKRFFPSELARKVSRLGGWSMTISGIVYAGLWMFAPIPVAVAAGSAAVLTGVAIPLAYCFSRRNKFRNVA
jgi:hypothetical protein